MELADGRMLRAKTVISAIHPAETFRLIGPTPVIRKAFREEIPNTTKLIISQRISSIEDADRIVVLNEGRIEGVGTHAELLASNAIYQEVYETQKKGEDEHEQA